MKESELFHIYVYILLHVVFPHLTEMQTNRNVIHSEY